MQKLLLHTALLLTLSAGAYAADAPATPAAPAATKSFADVKATRLQHIAEKIALYQKAQTCVQAAADTQALQACLPKGQGHFWHHGRKGDNSAAPASAQ